MKVINEYTEKKRKENLERLKTYDKETLIECIVNQSDNILKLTEQILPENYELHHRIDKAIEILQDYDLVENKDKVISDTFKALRGKDNVKDKR